MCADRFAVIGDPIDHSLSPTMQKAALEAAGLDATYKAIHVAPEELAAATTALFKQFKGLNVTVPHKVAVMDLLIELHPLAARVGAVNTVVIRDGVTTGFNTDVEGFRAALDVGGIQIAGGRAVVLGSGGAARAAAVALAGLNADVTVVSRNDARAQSVALLGSGSGFGRSEAAAAEAVALADLIVNATSLGLGGLADGNPLVGFPCLKEGACLFDLIYGRPTPFQRFGRERGHRVFDGLEMLVHQGASSFRLFTGREPDIAVMRAACQTALAANTLVGVRR